MADLLDDLRRHPLIAQPWGDFGPIEVLDRRANERGTPSFVGVMNHHTVSGANSGQYPCMGICRNGRGGPHPVPGPLCNILGARGGGSIAVISRRVANHAGTGDPDVIRRLRAGQPVKARPGRDADGAGGGPATIGIEWENNGTGEPWTPRMIDTMRRVNAALCDLYRWVPETQVIGHLEFTTRKIDPAFHTPRLTMGDFRGLVVETLAAYRSGTTPTPKDDEMTPAQEAKLDDVAKAVADLTVRLDTLATGGHYAGHETPGIIASLAAIRRQLAGTQGDEARTLRQIVEAVRNKVS